MRCPQWPHDFEPIALGFRLANHQTMNAIKANGTSRKSKTPSMTISSGKPMVRIGRSVSNFCKLGAPLLPPASFPPPQSFRLPDELLAHLPGTDGHLRTCTRHAGAHAAVGLVELGFRRVAGLAPFLVFLVQAFEGRSNFGVESGMTPRLRMTVCLLPLLCPRGLDFLFAGFQSRPGRVRDGPRVFLLGEPSPDGPVLGFVEQRLGVFDGDKFM